MGFVLFPLFKNYSFFGNRMILLISNVLHPNFVGLTCIEMQRWMLFLDSHVRFFEMLGGSFKEGVYDNMKNLSAPKLFSKANDYR